MYKRGFTIVELLIVIVVIAILAAITIVAYNGIQARANDASVRADLTAIAKKFEIFNVDNDRYPNTVTELESLSLRLAKGAYLTDPSTIQSNVVACLSSSSKEFTITAVTSSGTRLYAGSGKSVTEYSGSTSWLGTGNYANMCSSTLAGSTAIGSGAGWSSAWRPWTGN